MSLRGGFAVLLVLLLAAGCSRERATPAAPDAATVPDAASADAGTPPVDAASPPDAGAPDDAFVDDFFTTEGHLAVLRNPGVVPELHVSADLFRRGSLSNPWTSMLIDSIEVRGADGTTIIQSIDGHAASIPFGGGTFHFLGAGDAVSTLDAVCDGDTRFGLPYQLVVMARVDGSPIELTDTGPRFTCDDGLSDPPSAVSLTFPTSTLLLLTSRIPHRTAQRVQTLDDYARVIATATPPYVVAAVMGTGVDATDGTSALTLTGSGWWLEHRTELCSTTSSGFASFVVQVRGTATTGPFTGEIDYSGSCPSPPP